jgi:hypothetical protein
VNPRPEPFGSLFAGSDTPSGRRLGITDTGNLGSIPGEGTDHGDNTDTAADGGARGPVAGPEYHSNVVAQTAKPQHNLEHLGWKPACCADTFGVIAGEAAP